MTTSSDPEKVKLVHVSVFTVRYEHKRITAEFSYKGHYRVFSRVTDLIHKFDEADELTGQERNETLADWIKSEDLMAK